MSTVIGTIEAQLGLDASKFVQGTQTATTAQTKMVEQAQRLYAQQLAAAKDAFAKEVEAARQMRDERLKATANVAEVEAVKRVYAQEVAAAQQAAKAQIAAAQEAHLAATNGIRPMVGEMENLTKTATNGHITMNTLRSSMTTFTNYIVGNTTPGVAQLVSGLGGMAYGSAVMVGVLAGVAALGAAWRLATRDIREAKQEADAAMNTVKNALQAKRDALGGELQRGIVEAESRRYTVADHPFMSLDAIKRHNDEIDREIAAAQEKLRSIIKEAQDANTKEWEDGLKAQQKATRSAMQDQVDDARRHFEELTQEHRTFIDNWLRDEGSFQKNFDNSTSSSSLFILTAQTGRNYRPGISGPSLGSINSAGNVPKINTSLVPNNGRVPLVDDTAAAVRDIMNSKDAVSNALSTVGGTFKKFVENIPAGIIAGTATAGIGLAVGFLAKGLASFIGVGGEVQRIQAAMEQAKQATIAARQAQEAYNQSLKTAFGATQTPAQQYEEEFRNKVKALTTTTAGAGFAGSGIDTADIDYLRQLVAEYRSGNITGSTTAFYEALGVLLDKFDEGTKRLEDDAKRAAEAQAKQQAADRTAFAKDLNSREMNLGGLSYDEIRRRLEAQKQEEMDRATAMLNAGTITRDMFDRLAKILDGELNKALNETAEAAKRAAEAAQAQADEAYYSHEKIHNEYLRSQGQGDAADLADFIDQQLKEWNEAAKKFTEGILSEQDLRELQATQQKKLADFKAKQAGALNAGGSDQPVSAVQQEVIRGVAGIAQVQAIQLIDLQRSSNILLGEISFNTRALRGDGVGVFTQPAPFGRANQSGLTIENFTLEVGTLIADDRGVQALAVRMFRYLDQLMGSQIDARNRLSGNMGIR